MSLFKDALKIFESIKCEECGGLGEVDDAELGDISYRTFKCKPCHGTGFKDGKPLYLRDE